MGACNQAALQKKISLFSNGKFLIDSELRNRASDGLIANNLPLIYQFEKDRFIYFILFLANVLFFRRLGLKLPFIFHRRHDDPCAPISETSCQKGGLRVYM